MREPRPAVLLPAVLSIALWALAATADEASERAAVQASTL